MVERILMFSFLLLASCNSNRGLHSIEWRKGDSLSQLNSLEKVEVSPVSKIQSLSETVEIQQQSFHGVKLEGAYLKKIKNSGGETLSVRGSISLNEKKLENLLLADFEKRRATILRDIQEAFPIFKSKPPEKIDVTIIHHGNYYEPVWDIIYTDKHSIPWEMKLGAHMQIRSVQRVGSQFHDIPAFVFPKGPKISNLQEVILKGMEIIPTLSNERLSVTSQADSKISDLNGPLNFSPQDARFDQVQAFYFLDESLNWFNKYLNIKLPFALQAEVAVGSPEKTNSAFYYQGKIRFGAGDDQTYSHIPHDPSIVVHESVHALIDVIAHLPYEGEGGSLNEAFADFFTAVQLDNPNMGEAAYLKGPFRRSLVNAYKLADKNGGLYHDSGIVSGTLWDLRLKLGIVKARQLGLLTLNRLTPASDLVDFAVQLKEVLPQVLAQEEQAAVLAIIEQRGF